MAKLQKTNKQFKPTPRKIESDGSLAGPIEDKLT